MESDEEFLGATTHTAATVKCGWRANSIKRKLNSKIDTGADVTMIPEADYSKRRDGLVTPVDEPLNGPSQQRLEIVGRFQGTLK